MTHQPPEYQNIPTFRGVVREANHDNFGLAVLIFQLLFMGRHPFSGRYLGEGEMPIERAIQEHRFAYGISAKSRLMEQPPNVISINAVPQEVFYLFERAFMQELRPKAQEWVLSLDRLRARLKACSNPFHKYYEGLLSCPLCEVESKTGIVLFNYRGVIAGSLRIFNITAILKEIGSVQGPGELPPIPPKTSVRKSPIKQYLAYRNKRNNRRLLSAIIAVSGIAVLFLTTIEAAGAIHKTILTGNTSSYEIKCGEDHHHHLICRNCGKTEIINFCPLKEMQKELSEKNFTLTDHKFELYGYCKECENKCKKAK
jgi:DNA-binding helix-hairpin-helix protein with protein kinase domain